MTKVNFSDLTIQNSNIVAQGKGTPVDDLLKRPYHTLA
jgi:hypothetical protein